MPKSCIDPGRPSLSIPRSATPTRGGWLARCSKFFASWLRFSAGLYISLACAFLARADGGPRERIRFLDGKVELCEVLSSDADGVVLKLDGISSPLRFRWWQISAADASRIRDARAGKADVSPDAEFSVTGLRVRTLDGRVFEGLPSEGAPEGQLWLRNAEGRFVVRTDAIESREEIRVDLLRAYSPDEVVGILVGRIRPRSPDDYDLLGNQLLRAKLQGRAVAAFKIAEMLRHPESPEGRIAGELVKLREQIEDLAVRKAVYHAEEEALAGAYDEALAQVEALEKLMAGRPTAVDELRRVRALLQEFRGLARDERIVMETWRALEALLKLKAMDRTLPFDAARSWAEEALAAQLYSQVREKFKFSPDDPTLLKVWEARPAEALLKHSYEGASWVLTRPELRPGQDWWSAADDRSRYRLLKGLFIEKHLKLLSAESKNCALCGGAGLLAGATCPECQGLKSSRVLIYR